MYSFELVASCIEWSEDKNSISCNAACEFFFQILNTRRDHYTAEFVTLVLTKVIKSASFLSLQTRKGNHPSISLLLKAMLLCCSRDKLHQLQIILLHNGCFLTHLHRALVGGDSKDMTLSQEIVMGVVTDSADGLRTLSRIFPAPLVKKLELPSNKTRFSGVSYKMPIADSDADLRLLDNMALGTVFPVEANWRSFWSSLQMESSQYDFIWNATMRQQAVTYLARELEDMRYESVWDYDGFRVPYPQLQKFVCVDGYYLQQMLDAYEKEEQVTIVRPVDFVHHLCDLFIVSRCITDRRALFYLMLRVVQGEDTAVKDFPVLRYLCFVLEDPSVDPLLLDLTLQILEGLCVHQRNTEQFQDYNGLDTVSRILTEAIHTVIQGTARSVPETESEGSLKCRVTMLPDLDRVLLILQILNNACHSMVRIRPDMIREPILSRMLRVPLLWVDERLTRILFDTLSLSLASSARLQTSVFRSGLFQVLLLCSCGSSGMNPTVSDLLWRYNCLQDPSDVQASFGDAGEKVDITTLVQSAGDDKEKMVALARKYSYLRFFLPSCLIALLMREGPERFREVFTAESVENSDVLWGAELRAHLSSELQQQFAPYIEKITVDPTKMWEYSIPAVIQYVTIEDKLCVCNVFLESFLKEECEVPYTVDSYQFLSELIRELELRLNAVHNMSEPGDLTYKDVSMILRSLLKLLRTKKEISKVGKKAFAVLGRCLTANLASANNVDMANDALEVISEALKPQSYGKPSSVNLCECAEANCIADFDLVMQYCSSDTLSRHLGDPNHPLSKVMLHTLQCICLLAGKTTTRSLESLVAYPQFIHSLMPFIYLDNVELSPLIGLEVLKAFELFLHDEKLLEIVVNWGGLISFTQITLCLENKVPVDKEIIDTAVRCLELLAGVGNTAPAPSIVLDAMTQLLTPGLMKALRNHTFLEKMRSQHIRHPLLIWNLDMATRLSEVLADEEDLMDNNKEVGNGYWNVHVFCRRGGYLSIYPNLQSEYIVDEVFLTPFLERPDTELTDPSPDHFMKALMVNVIQLQGAQELGLSNKNDRTNVLNRLLVSLRSLYALLSCHSNLQQGFVNDCNIHKLFDLLCDTTIGWDLQAVLLSLLQVAVSTQSGCDILSSFVPSLRMLLQSNCHRAYLPVLNILDQFSSHNDLVVLNILTSGIILVLLDMILSFENDYDGDVQDTAVILLGRLMKNPKYGEDVRKYIVALFTPLFRGESEKSQVLKDCDKNPSEFLDVLSSDIHTPTVYWDSRVREDLKNFLRSESRTMRTTDQEYEYRDVEVAKRIKPTRVTLNAQLIVADIFIWQFIESPFCEIQQSAFLSGLIKNLKADVNVNEKKEDYCALMKALYLFLQDNKETLEDSLYTAVVSFCVSVLRENVVTAQETVLSTLEFIVQQPYGIKEFERNNASTEERSYIVDLLQASSVLASATSKSIVLDTGNSYRVTEILRVLVTKNAALRGTCYHAGALFYAFASVLSYAGDIDAPRCSARVYLEIIRELVIYVPNAESDILEFTTSKFQDQFKKEPSIISLFIRMKHEAYDKEGKIRVWSIDVREALRDFMADRVSKLNAESGNSKGWDRTSDRFTMDGVDKLWENYYKKSSPTARKVGEEETGIKLRQTTFERVSRIKDVNMVSRRPSS